ncbi:MAG: hypothetical protein LBI84_09065, partial [Propionibacteriaceae bacterium]|nr:hypothetical protein [Propionibacteriaceae bacterium]
MRNILLAQFLNPWGGGMQRAMTEDLRQLSTVFPDTVLLITHEYENWVSNLRDYRRSFSLQDERIVSLTKFAQESALGRWYDTAKDSLILKIKEISSAAFERSNLLKLQADGRNYIFWTDRTSGYESESKTENLNSDSIATIVKKSRVVTVWSDSGVKKYLLSDGRIEKIKYLDHRWQETGATYLNKIGNVVFEWVADDFYGRKYKQFIDFNYPEAVLGERDFRRVLLNFYLGQEGAESNLIVQDIGLAPTVYCLNDRWLRKIFFVFHAAHFKWGQKDVTDLRATEASLLLQKSLFDSSQVCVVTKTRQQAADISETCPWTATANVAISHFRPPRRGGGFGGGRWGGGGVR